MTKVLVTGGAGFIGTHVVKELVEAGYDVTVIDLKDNEQIRKLLPDDNIIIDDFVNACMYDLESFDAVMHFAASHSVGESVNDPFGYYDNNITKTIRFLQDLIEHNVNNFVFSGSSSVYGNNCGISCNEVTPHDTVSPYASSKSITETVLKDLSACYYDFNYVTLRYFNAAGADPSGFHGYTQKDATHLVPIVCRALLDNEQITVFGDDWPGTIDNTCMRDYTHVSDLASGHVLALKYLQKAQRSNTFNLGGGRGATVLQMIDKVAGEAGIEPNIVFAPRRPGDPERLVADITRAEHVLGWKPKYTLEDIAYTALNWEKKCRDCNLHRWQLHSKPRAIW